jgi:hypothetical protein
VVADELDPTRRSLLRGAGAVGAALLATGLLGCSDDGGGDDQAGPTTTSQPAEDDGEANGPDRGEDGGEDGAAPLAGDVDLAVAGVTFENTTVELYRGLLDQRAAELSAAGLVPLLERLRDHHVEHAASLNRFLRQQGLDPVPSDRLFAGVTPLEEDELASLAVPDLVALLTEREDQLTHSYVDTLPRLTHAPLRLLVATVGATEARHVAALDLEAGGTAAYLARAASLPGGRYPVEQSLLRG